MSLPLVSVVIPSYNRFNYLLNAVDSVLNQDYKKLKTEDNPNKDYVYPNTDGGVF